MHQKRLAAGLCSDQLGRSPDPLALKGTGKDKRRTGERQGRGKRRKGIEETGERGEGREGRREGTEGVGMREGGKAKSRPHGHS